MQHSPPPEQAHNIRITSQGKIKNYVSHALDVLKRDKDCYIVLHTLPLSTEKDEKESAAPQLQPPQQSKSLPPSTTTIPKLLSVVEIIKREYLKSLDATSAPRVHGLHQYNEISSLEEEQGHVTTDKQTEAEALKIALEGKNYLKRRQTPFMRVTLSRTEMPGRELNGASYQKPATRNMSKSARKRARKRDATTKDVSTLDISED